jgi:hypothetical protein
MILRGFIDDSGDSNTLVLSCLVGDGPTWVWMEFEWLDCIQRKNEALVASGRKPISRFHAADFSSRQGEFRGWDTQLDQIPFMSELTSIIKRHPLDVVAYTVDLGLLATHVQYARSNPKRFGHAALLHYIMRDIANGSLKNNRDATIGIVHERGTYDAVLLDAFTFFLDNQAFLDRFRFLSFIPMGWEKCVPLQIADLVAYENFKEVQRQPTDRDRRKSLQIILDGEKWGGHFKELDDSLLFQYGEFIERLPREVREAFLATVRIRDPSPLSAQ